MRRRTVHGMFALLVVACGFATVWQATSWVRARDLNAAILAADSSVKDRRAPQTAPTDRRLQLAQAVALAKAGEYDAALKTFGALIAHNATDAAARDALFDMGNLYVRQSLQHADDRSVAVPLVELAKQRYRDLLRIDPADWPARYNLERALRMVPEDKEAFEQPGDTPVQRPQNKLPELLAPDLP